MADLAALLDEMLLRIVNRPIGQAEAIALRDEYAARLRSAGVTAPSALAAPLDVERLARAIQTHRNKMVSVDYLHRCNFMCADAIAREYAALVTNHPEFPDGSTAAAGGGVGSPNFGFALRFFGGCEDVERLAAAINDAQIDPAEMSLGRDLRPVAARILAALASLEADRE